MKLQINESLDIHPQLIIHPIEFAKTEIQPNRDN